jgi:oligopeptide transport system substrate-binding protein
MLKHLLYIFAGLTLVFSGCNTDQKADSKRIAKGNVYYGGVFRVNEKDNFASLFPLGAIDVHSINITSQIFEGLTKFNAHDLSVSPALASKWQSNEDATVWTFQIRSNVYFQDDECFPDGQGRLLTAQDVVYSFTKLCSHDANNLSFDFTFKDYVLGAEEYYASTKRNKSFNGSVEGIKQLDDSTVQISLKKSYSGFPNMLASFSCAIFPKEAVEKYGVDIKNHPVGTGPFALKYLKQNDNVVLERNAKYWAYDEKGNQLPYLDAVKYSFIKEDKTEVLEFKNGKLDMISQVPTEYIKEFKEGTLVKSNNYTFSITPGMSTFLYGFNINIPAFKDPRVRKAINLAIDRHKFTEYTLQGVSIPADKGFVSPVQAFEDQGYAFSQINGHAFNPEKARKLLADAGFPNGKGFPEFTLETNSGNEENVLSAEFIQSSLKEVLNINTKINQLPTVEHLQNIYNNSCEVWKYRFTADFPDPMNFLTKFYGKNVPDDNEDPSYANPSRYKNAKFDSLIEIANNSKSSKERYENFAKAEQILIDDAAFIPMFHNQINMVVKNRTKNLPINGMGFRDLSKVYLVPIEQQEQEKNMVTINRKPQVSYSVKKFLKP